MKLKIEGLSAGYDKDFVIKDLSLSVNQGEFLSLLGPSGCGKTTLMKAVAGILPAQGGRILLDGEDITSLPIHKRGTVIVFQDMRLFPHMTVEENVAFPFKMQGVWRSGSGSWTSPVLPWTKLSERICGILSFSYSGNSI